MKFVLDETHESKAQSWVESANVAGSDFPIQNLAFGVFRRRDASAQAGGGIAIGDRILDVAGMRSEGLLAEEGGRLAANACAADSLNPLMALGSGARRVFLRRLPPILRRHWFRAALRCSDRRARRAMGMPIQAEARTKFRTALRTTLRSLGRLRRWITNWN